MRLRMALAGGLVLACLGCPHHPSSPDAGGSGGTSGGGGSSGGTSGGTTGSTGSAAYATWCRAMSQVLCDFLSRCQAVDPGTDCVKQLDLKNCKDGDAIAAGYKRFDAASAQRCLNGLGGAPCNDQFVTSIESQDCNDAVQPNVASGGSCTRDSDCLQPDGGYVTCGRTDNTSCLGTCGGRNGAQIGQPCAYPPDYPGCAQGYCAYGLLSDGGYGFTVCIIYAAEGASCSNGAECDPSVDFCQYGSNGAPTCAPLLGAGATCSSSTQCQSTLYCPSPSDGGFTATCVQRSGPGGPCDTRDYRSCLDSTQCIQGTCKPYRAGLGQPCDQDTSCSQGTCSNPDGGSGTCIESGQDAGFGGTLDDPCDGTRPCSIFYQCASGRCATLPSAGQPCYASSDISCLFGLSCSSDAGVCEHGAMAGEACEPGVRCNGSYCDPSANVCKPYLAAGSPCDPALFECSGNTRCTGYSDGGQSCVDEACITPSDGGSPFCNNCP